MRRMIDRFVGAPSCANVSDEGVEVDDCRSGFSRVSKLRAGKTIFAPEGAPTCKKRRFHGEDLRKGRWSGEHQSYLITTVTQHRERFFVELAAARALIRALMLTQESGLAHTHAFVVMPDHLHWLMSLGEVVSLSTCVGQIKGESGRRINAMLGRVHQAVWQHGFHDHALRQDEDMRQIARYVVANPLRAGLVDQVGDYPWWDAEWL